MEDELFEKRTDLSKLSHAVEQIKTTLAKIIVGQQESIDLLIAGILAACIAASLFWPQPEKDTP